MLYDRVQTFDTGFKFRAISIISLHTGAIKVLFLNRPNYPTWGFHTIAYSFIQKLLKSKEVIFYFKKRYYNYNKAFLDFRFKFAIQRALGVGHKK